MIAAHAVIFNPNTIVIVEAALRELFGAPKAA
jgi:hypothetical protein